jgi:hypothetical protein
MEYVEIFIKYVACCLRSVLYIVHMRIYEVRRDRRRIRVTTGYGQCPDNDVHIVYLSNPYKTPIMIDYWQMVWLKKFLLMKLIQIFLVRALRL